MGNKECCICKEALKGHKTFTDVRGNISHISCFLNHNKKDYLQMMLNAAEVAGTDLSMISDWSQTNPEKISEMSEQHLDINYINLVGGYNGSI